MSRGETPCPTEQHFVVFVDHARAVHPLEKKGGGGLRYKQFPKKAHRLVAIGSWRLVAVGGGWWRLVVGDWWLVALGSGWRLAVGRRWRLAAVGGWR